MRLFDSLTREVRDVEPEELRVRQRAFASGQRGWKEHPLGRSAREGGLPGTLSRTDLSPEQRAALAQSQIAVMLKLQEAAAAGDKKAGQIMEMHRASK